MVDLNFQNPVALVTKEGDQKPMKPIEDGKFPQRLPAHHPQKTPGVLHLHTRDPIPVSVCHPGGEAAHGRISSRRRRTPTTAATSPCRRLDHARKVRRIILAIRIQGQDDAAPGVRQTRRKCRTLPAVLPVADDPQLRMLPLQASQDGHRVIPTGVVHRHNFPRLSQPAQRLMNLPHERAHVLLLVEDG
jgi:hypothetical protein